MSEGYVPSLWATLPAEKFFLLVHLTPQKLAWKATAAEDLCSKLRILPAAPAWSFYLVLQSQAADLPTAVRHVKERVSRSYKKMVFIEQLPDLL